MFYRVVLKGIKDKRKIYDLAQFISKEFKISLAKSYSFLKRIPFTLYNRLSEEELKEKQKLLEQNGAILEIIPLKNEEVKSKKKAISYKYVGKSLDSFDKNTSTSNDKIEQEKNDSLNSNIYLYILLVFVVLLFISSIVFSGIILYKTGILTKYFRLKNREYVLKKENKKLRKLNNKLKYNMRLKDSKLLKIFEEGKFQEVIRIIEERLKIYPNDPDLYKLYAMSLYNLAYYDAEKNDWKDYGKDLNDLWKDPRLTKAIEALKKAIDLRPNDYEAYNFLGVIYSDKGWFYKALSMYEKSLSINPYYDEALYNISQVLVDLGRYKEAEKYLHILITKNPKYKNGYLALGYLYLEFYKDTLKAISYFEQYKKIKPRDENYIIVTQLVNRLKRAKGLKIDYKPIRKKLF